MVIVTTIIRHTIESEYKRLCEKKGSSRYFTMLTKAEADIYLTISAVETIWEEVQEIINK